MATWIWYPIFPLLATSVRYLPDKKEVGPHQRELLHPRAFRLQ
jgi:hypothetical protein